MTQTLFDKYGGYPTVQVLVENFYNKVKEDQTLQHFFANTDWQRLIKHQVAFVSQVMGGPTVYKGLDMAKAHQRFNINDSHFDSVATHLLKTLQEASVAQEDIDQIMAAVGSLRSKVVHAIDPRSVDRSTAQTVMIDQTHADQPALVQEVLKAKEALIAQKDRELERLQGDLAQLTGGKSFHETLYNLRRAKELVGRLEQANQKIWGSGERRFLLDELKQLF